MVGTGMLMASAVCNGWAAANVSSDTSRAAAIGAVVVGGNLGALFSAWTFLPKDAPLYHTGNSINLGTACGQLAFAAVLLVYMVYDNQRRTAGAYDRRLDGLTIEQAARLGHRHPGFKWKY